MTHPMAKIKKWLGGQIGIRLFIYIILFSFFITLVTTALQLVFDYRAERERIISQFENIKKAYLEPLTSSVWFIDDSQIQSQLDGLEKLPDVEYVSVNVEGSVKWEAGGLSESHKNTKEYTMTYINIDGKQTEIGTLLVVVDIEAIYRRIGYKGGMILIWNGLKTFAVSGFMLLIFWRLVTKHLLTLSAYAKKLDLENLGKPLEFNRTKKRNNADDELDDVARAINEMRQSLSDTFLNLNESRLNYKQQTLLLKHAQKELHELLFEREKLLMSERALTDNLEKKVEQRTEKLSERTKELEEKSSSLENSLQQLRDTQEQLLESKKLAALGGMVAGVAHEINTPIGVCLTSASLQKDKCNTINKLMDNDCLTREDFRRFTQDVADISDLFERNIKRASNLIIDFKAMAVDEHHDEAREFLLLECIEQIVRISRSNNDVSKVNFLIEVPSDIHFVNHPRLINQIISQLISNSIVHGFADGRHGIISIIASKTVSGVTLIYKDNGLGIDLDDKQHIFEPFFTTKRRLGNTGLGLTIVFNVICGKLKGTIDIIDSDVEQGLHYRICLPEDIQSSPQTESTLG